MRDERNAHGRPIYFGELVYVEAVSGIAFTKFAYSRAAVVERRRGVSWLPAATR